MLGIIIGVAAVIVIVGLGNGMEEYVTDSFSEHGHQYRSPCRCSPGAATRTVEEDDMYAMVEKNAAVPGPVLPHGVHDAATREDRHTTPPAPPSPGSARRILHIDGL